MKLVAAFLSSLIFCPASVSGQSTLTFARLIGAAEMRAVGIAVVNPTPMTAPVTFTLYGASGDVINSATLLVPAGGQLAKLASELFPNAADGWVQATSGVTALRGFWLFGDFANYADAAESAQSASDLVIPLVTDSSDVTVVNTSSSEATLLMRLYGQDGQEVAEPIVEVLAARGAFRSSSRDLFDPLDWSAAGHIEITSAVALAASVAVTNFRIAPTLVALNGNGASTAAAELIFPHVVHGRLGAKDFVSVLSVTNVGATSQAISLTFVPAGGLPPRAVQFTLAGKSTLRMNAQTLFALTGFQNGFVRVTSARGLIGFVWNGDNEEGGAAATSGQSRSQTSLLFGHIANSPPWWMGLALVNPGTSPASVEVTAIAPDGKIIGTTNAVIPASEKTVRLIDEWIPAMQARSSDGGFVFVRSTIPIYGLALFFTRDLRILSNVPALDLAPSTTFNPRP